LAEVETDKATMELVARGSGVMRKQLIGEGDTSNVGTLIGVVAAEDEDIDDILGEGAAVEQSASAEEAPGESADAAGEAATAVAASGETEPHQAQKAAEGEAAGGVTAAPQGTPQDEEADGD